MNTLYQITNDNFDAIVIEKSQLESLIDDWDTDGWTYSVQTTGDEIRVYCQRDTLYFAKDDDPNYNQPGQYTDWVMFTHDEGYIVAGYETEYTQAEQEIVDLLRQDPTLSNEDIADKLTKSVNTINKQISSIYQRNGIISQRGNDSRIEWYYKIGWLNPS